MDHSYFVAMISKDLFRLFSILAVIFHTADATCSFPSALQGTWRTNTNGDITIGATTLTNYPVGFWGNMDFDCDELYNGRYVLKSQTTITIINVQSHAFFCFDFIYVSENLYYYYLCSADNGGLQVYYSASWSTPTAAQVCSLDASAYPTGLYQVMVKDGDAAAAAQTCPTALQGFWTYTLDQGSGNVCSTSGSLDVCKPAASKNQLMADTACSSNPFYSSGGLLYCLAAPTSGSTTYLTVYNQDTSVNGSTTYQMTCLVFEESGTALVMTQYPGACEETQTSTSVTTPTGGLLTLSTAGSCPVYVPPTDYTWYIIMGLICGGSVLVIILFAIVIFCTWKAKRRPFRGRLEPEGKNSPRSLEHYQNGGLHTRRIRHPGLSPLDRDDDPADDLETPINVLSLLRKDVNSVTASGRESPPSHVLLSVVTPIPSHQYDGDSMGGGSMPIPAENPSVRKHYHVIGGEMPMEDEYPAADGGALQRMGLSPRNAARTPVMVLPVRNHPLVDNDNDDYSDEDDVMYDADGTSTLVAARQGVGISEPMCPPTRLPPIDEGPATHRSYTGAGNPARRTPSGPHITPTAVTASASSLPDAAIKPVLPGAAPPDTPPPATRTPRAPQAAAVAGDTGSEAGASRPSSRAETPSGRRSSLGMIYKTDGNITIAVPDVLDQVTTGSGTLDGGEDGRSSSSLGSRGQAKLKSFRRPSISGHSTDRLHVRRGSHSSPRQPHSARSSPVFSTSADSRKRKQQQAAGARRPRKQVDHFAHEDEMKVKSRVKSTRVDLPELLSPGELYRRHVQDDHDLIESPGRCFTNAGFELEGGSGGSLAESGGVEPPKNRMLQPSPPAQEVWSKVSSLWRLGQAWSDKSG